VVTGTATTDTTSEATTMYATWRSTAGRFIAEQAREHVKAAASEPGRRLGEHPAERDMLALAWDMLSRPGGPLAFADRESGGW
jgi:hypothetical protein